MRSKRDSRVLVAIVKGRRRRTKKQAEKLDLRRSMKLRIGGRLKRKLGDCRFVVVVQDAKYICIRAPQALFCQDPSGCRSNRVGELGRQAYPTTKEPHSQASPAPRGTMQTCKYFQKSRPRQLYESIQIILRLLQSWRSMGPRTRPIQIQKTQINPPCRILRKASKSPRASSQSPSQDLSTTCQRPSEYLCRR